MMFTWNMRNQVIQIPHAQFLQYHIDDHLYVVYICQYLSHYVVHQRRMFRNLEKVFTSHSIMVFFIRVPQVEKLG